MFGNVAGGPPPTSAGLVINPIWDSSILNDPNVTEITNTINTAILSLESRFYDPVTVNILFQEMGTGLGQSETWIGTIPYSSYYNALVADSKTTNDTIALAHVTGGPNNPVNGGANITLPLAGLRALGFTANSPTNWDSIVSLNTSIMNYTRPPLDPSAYDLQATVTHEMDEVLGTSSGVGQANIHPPDLFRYTSAGARSFTTAGDDAWFSIDGAINLVQYNQDPSGDYGDWWSSSPPAVPRVQDAFATPGVTPDLAEELIVLDVVGWDLVPASVQPPVLHVSVTGTTVHLSWSSAVPNRPYQVQYKTNLTQASWLNLGSVVTATNTTMTATDTTTSGPERFYRVAMLPARSAAQPINQGDIKGPFVLDTRVMNPKPGNIVRPPSRGIRLVQPRAVPIAEAQAE